MKKIFIIASFIAILFLAFMGSEPINLSDELIIEISEDEMNEVVTQNLEYRLYPHESKMIVEYRLTYLKSFESKSLNVSDYQTYTLGTSSYNISVLDDDMIQMNANLYVTLEGQYAIVMNVIQPFAFSVGDGSSMPLDSMFFEYTPFYDLQLAYRNTYLLFNDSVEYEISQSSVIDNYTTLPINTYSQYFKHPKVIHSVLYILEKNEAFDSVFFEFMFSYFHKTEEIQSIQLGFNQFINSAASVSYYAKTYKVSYEEE